MRSPFTHYICFNTPAPALAGHGHRDQFVIVAPGRGPGCFEEKSRLPANVIHDDIHPQAKSVHYYGIPRLFTRFLRKADYIGSNTMLV
jgi:hypothetical protein